MVTKERWNFEKATKLSPIAVKQKAEMNKNEDRKRSDEQFANEKNRKRKIIFGCEEDLEKNKLGK